MNAILRRSGQRLLQLLLTIAVYFLLVRLVRTFVAFPIPPFMARVIDNPLRRRLQPPIELAHRHGLTPGMRVLEIGPGSGTYTVAAARVVGRHDSVGRRGSVVALDIAPRILRLTAEAAARAGATNIQLHQADVGALPFAPETFDAVVLISVIGELPDPHQALREFHRVLRPGGTLALSELWLDPDCRSSTHWIAAATHAGFCLETHSRRSLDYSLRFCATTRSAARPAVAGHAGHDMMNVTEVAA